MEEGMTNEQMNKILEMIITIIENCESVEEAVEKLRKIQETE